MSQNIEPTRAAVRINGYVHKEGVFKAKGDSPRTVPLNNVDKLHREPMVTASSFFPGTGFSECSPNTFI